MKVGTVVTLTSKSESTLSEKGAKLNMSTLQQFLSTALLCSNDDLTIKKKKEGEATEGKPRRRTACE